MSMRVNKDLDTALDEAQAKVFSGEAPEAYLIIKIVPDA